MTALNTNTTTEMNDILTFFDFKKIIFIFQNKKKNIEDKRQSRNKFHSGNFQGNCIVASNIYTILSVDQALDIYFFFSSTGIFSYVMINFPTSIKSKL